MVGPRVNETGILRGHPQSIAKVSRDAAAERSADASRLTERAEKQKAAMVRGLRTRTIPPSYWPVRSYSPKSNPYRKARFKKNRACCAASGAISPPFQRTARAA